MSSKIRKFLLIPLLSFFMAAMTSGCSQAEKSSSITLQDKVSFTLLDALKVDNLSTNTVYYYFLAAIENESSKNYYMSNLEYNITEEGQQAIAPIDRFQSTITEDITPGTSSFVYGYIGYPNSDERNVGLEFPRTDEFLAFDSITVRTINDTNIVNSTESAFTIYEDDYFEFDVDSSQVSYDYKDGVSLISGLEISYRNKTESRLVVPYLTPVCTMTGVYLADYKNEKDLIKMSLADIKKQNFDINNLPPKTSSMTGKSIGYQLYYLTPSQEFTCQISFEFEGFVPDFKNDEKHSISIKINSASLGYMQNIPVSY